MEYARSAHILIAILSLTLLSACAGMRIVDSQVTAFSRLDALPATPFRWSFERLPSQQNLEAVQAVRHNKLENMVTLELAKLGFAAAPSAAGLVSYTVQIQARIVRQDAGPFDEPAHWGLPGRDYMVTSTGQLIYMPVWPRYTPPWYVRDLSLLIRDTKDSRIVYETQARHEGRWSDDEAVLPAMFAAALQGFPKPPEGKRMVNIEIPR
jgi:hypothetical protein